MKERRNSAKKGKWGRKEVIWLERGKKNDKKWKGRNLLGERVGLFIIYFSIITTPFIAFYLSIIRLSLYGFQRQSIILKWIINFSSFVQTAEKKRPFSFLIDYTNEEGCRMDQLKHCDKNKKQHKECVHKFKQLLDRNDFS